MRPIPAAPETSIGDFRRYSGARLLLACGFCSWSKSYHPERVLGRLHELRAGGHMTRLADVVLKVRWSCPGCSRRDWRMQFAWPADLTEAEARRLANRYRN